ncbi:MAG: hypothetical protein N2257_05670 [Thermodesulfovibrionales bacterium]|nr:hypothetical protein [Thermodesulfovibrionales bacterium]
MSRKEAKLVLFLSAGLIMLVWLIEFKKIFDFSLGEPEVITGRIINCDGTRSGFFKWKKEKFMIYIDSFTEGRIEFVRPVSVKNEIINLCERRELVKVIYKIWKAPFRQDYEYCLLGITDLKDNRVIFTPADYEDWKKGNRLWAYGILGLAFLGFLYAFGILTGLIFKKDKIGFKPEQNYGYYRGQLIIRSKQRRDEALIFLFLFAGLFVTFIYYYLSGKVRSFWLLFPSLVCLAGAYAYLIEIVNVNELRIDKNLLHYTQKPLPWIFNRCCIPVDLIKEFITEETKGTSIHGKYTLYSVAIKKHDGEILTLFFTNTLEEAETIVELSNKYLFEQHK